MKCMDRLTGTPIYTLITDMCGDGEPFLKLDGSGTSLLAFAPPPAYAAMKLTSKSIAYGAHGSTDRYSYREL